MYSNIWKRARLTFVVPLDIWMSGNNSSHHAGLGLVGFIIGFACRSHLRFFESFSMRIGLAMREKVMVQCNQHTVEQLIKVVRASGIRLTIPIIK